MRATDNRISIEGEPHEGKNRQGDEDYAPPGIFGWSEDRSQICISIELFRFAQCHRVDHMKRANAQCSQHAYTALSTSAALLRALGSASQPEAGHSEAIALSHPRSAHADPNGDFADSLDTHGHQAFHAWDLSHCDVRDLRPSYELARYHHEQEGGPEPVDLRTRIRATQVECDRPFFRFLRAAEDRTRIRFI
ncbi:hypothetical protein [Ramlibacter algicola]|uniref:Uncharacterized protein n=1 Tax=Ramlibacter algicola TaxID=2795217 RepID=A0A934PVQ7_9BURK|nr:hypothetical protein [Ramlibacter algicola]MBK0391354.1 hypothetical protein [Ramlibacter algicola]